MMMRLKLGMMTMMTISWVQLSTLKLLQAAVVVLQRRCKAASLHQWVEEADNVNSTRGGLLFVQLISLRTTSNQVPKVKSSYTLVAANSHLNFVCTSDWTTRTTWTT